MEEIAKIMWLMLAYTGITIGLIYSILILFNMSGSLAKTTAGVVIGVVIFFMKLTIILIWVWFTCLTIKQINYERENSNIQYNSRINNSDTTNAKVQRADTTRK